MTKIKNITFLTLFLTFFSLFYLLVSPVAAQNEGETLILGFNRDFGYGGFGGEIQGRFSLRVKSPEDIIRVAYYLDGDLVYEGIEFPFKWQFNTAEFPDGRHTFSAIGYKADGTEVRSDPFERIFLNSEQAWSETGSLIVPLLIVVGAATAAGVLIPLLFGRKKKHIPGVYSVVGGAICPRCSFPYSRHVFAPNMLVGKLERCPHCGKWAIAPRAAPHDLQAAEERLSSEGEGLISSVSEEEKMRQMIEESRFEE